ncbi:hypothetical protein [Amycolatopsis sp. NPDC021455]|uniref:hypothetical protein n=1 Tax=Amycolatopsis sp. NPDC021455 TaxID=3154901 RepID=UPI0033F316AA
MLLDIEPPGWASRQWESVPLKVIFPVDGRQSLGETICGEGPGLPAFADSGALIG